MFASSTRSAAHPLLLSLGAVPAGARELLDDERLRSAVEESLDDDDPDELADVVLALVAARSVCARASCRGWDGSR